jgi:hypothetical protein
MSTMLSMLHSPTKTFEYIRERGGSFTIPLITLMVISLLAIILQIPMIERAIDAQEVDLGESGMSTETVKQIAVYSAVILAPVAVPAAAFFCGLILLLLNLIVRGEATYMQLVKVYLFSLIPNVISSILTGIMVRNSDADSAKDILFSLGALFQEKEGFLFGLANIINPFSIWSIAITIIGAAVMMRRPIRTVGIWIGGVWLVIQLIIALLA